MNKTISYWWFSWFIGNTFLYYAVRNEDYIMLILGVVLISGSATMRARLESLTQKKEGEYGNE